MRHLAAQFHETVPWWRYILNTIRFSDLHELSTYNEALTNLPLIANDPIVVAATKRALKSRDVFHRPESHILRSRYLS